MFTVKLASRTILSVLLMGLFIGAGVGWALAEQPETPNPSPPAGEEAQDRQEETASQYYKRVTGFSFRPVHYATTFVGSDGVCFHRSDDSGYGTLIHDLQLPDGAEVNQVTFYYYDASIVQSINFEMRAVDGFGNGPTIASFTSAGSSGFGSVDSPQFSYVVDNFDEVLTLRASFPDGVSSALRLCGARISYTYDLASNFLPAVLNQTMP
jgi:hypothetical protein